MRVLSEVQVVKMFGRQSYQRLRHAGLLTPFFHAEGHEGTAVYPEHLVRFRLVEDVRIRGGGTGTGTGTPTLVQKSTSARPRPVGGSQVHLQQQSVRTGIPVPPAVEREFRSLVRIAKCAILRLRRR
jgi:hypothetical protein